MPTCCHAARTACSSAPPAPNSSPLTSTVASAAAWKSEFSFSRVVRVVYQMLPAFSHAFPPMAVAARKKA